MVWQNCHNIRLQHFTLLKLDNVDSQKGCHNIILQRYNVVAMLLLLSVHNVYAT